MLDTQVQQGDKPWRSDAEKNEFDNISGDGIQAIRDVDKLRRMEKYYRQEGYLPTADAVRKRLQELGLQDPVRDPSLEKEAREELEGLKSWTAKVNAADRGAAVKSSGPASSLAAPPPRAGTAIKVGDAKQNNTKLAADANKPSDTDRDQQPKVKQDSKFGGQVRSGSDYYRKWDQFAEQAVQEEGDDDDEGQAAEAGSKPAAATAAKIAAAAARASASLTGSALTQKILQLNEGLAEKERLWNAEQEKSKGNESFRAQEYTEAVEHYTLSLGFNPANASVYANRAAAYFKLHMYQEVITDCDAALAPATPDQPHYLKALVRRAAARMELGHAKEAMQDIDAGLVVQPGNKELFTMRQRAAKALGIKTTRRMAIEEVEDEEEEEEEEPQQQQQQPEAVPATRRTSTGGGSTAGRIKLQVEEEDDDDDEEEEDVPVVVRTSAPVPAAVPVAQAAAPAPTPAPAPVQAAPKPTPPAASQPTPSRAPAATAVPKGRIRVTVEEEDDDDEDVVPRQTAGQQAPIQLPMPPAAPASTAPKQQDAAPTVKPPAKQQDKAAAASQTPAPASKTVSTTPAPAAATPAAVPEPSSAEKLRELQASASKCMSAGNHVRAIELFTQAVALEPDNVSVYISRAQARMKRGDLTGCLADAALAVALDPANPQAMKQRALVKMRLGLTKAAREDIGIAEGLAASAGDSRLKVDLLKERMEIDAELAVKSKARAGSKKTRYPGGVMIEELSDDEEEQAAGVGLARVNKVESGAASQALQLRKQAAALMADAQAKQQAAAQPASDTDRPAATVTATAPAAAPAAVAPSKQAVTAEELKEQAAQKHKEGLLTVARDLWVQAAGLASEGTSLAVACHANLALVFEQLDQPGDALHHACVALETEPDNKHALLRRMRALKSLGRLQEALEACRELRRKNPASVMLDQEMSELIAAATAAAPAPTPASAPASASAPSPGASTSTAAAPASQPAPASTKEEEADLLRTQGNTLYAQGDLQAALTHYTHSISVLPSAAAYANQALVLLKLNRAAEAEAASRAALALEPSHVKARVRLGQALRQLGKAQEAVEALQQAYDQSPSVQVAAELKAAQEELSQLQSFIQPQPPASSAPAKPAPASSARSKSTVTKVIEVKETCSSSDEQDTLLAHTPSSPPQQQPPSTSSQSSSKAGSSGGGEVPARTPTPPAAAPQSGGGAPTAGKLPGSAAVKAAAAIASLATKQPAPPKNSVDFQNACKLVGDDLEMLCAYVSSIEPASYPSLFKESLDNVCVTSLVKAFNQLVKSKPEFVRDCLENLSKVNRFVMVWTMMSKSDKAAVKSMLEQLSAQGVPTGELPVKYKV